MPEPSDMVLDTSFQLVIQMPVAEELKSERAVS